MTIDTIHDDKSLYPSQKKYKFQSDIFEKVFQKMSTTEDYSFYRKNKVLSSRRSPI